MKQEPHLKPYDEQNLANKVEPQVDIEPAGNDTMITCKLVLWSEKGELKKVVTMLMTVSVT